MEKPSRFISCCIVFLIALDKSTSYVRNPPCKCVFYSCFLFKLTINCLKKLCTTNKLYKFNTNAF